MGINVGGAASIAAVVQVTFADGSAWHAKTSTAWKGAKEAPTGWTESAFDDAAWPAAALVKAADEANAWTLRAYVSPDSPPASYLRKAFRLGPGIRKARVYASAKGLYVLHLNGQRVGEDLLRPGWTDYRDRFQYQTYDVTGLLKAGDNAVGVLLGDGWYAGHIAEWGRANYGPATRALVQLEVEREDGTPRAGRERRFLAHSRRPHPHVGPADGGRVRRAQARCRAGRRRVSPMRTGRPRWRSLWARCPSWPRSAPACDR